MTRQLTLKSSLDVLKKDAKRWLKALHAGDTAARIRLTSAWPKAPADPNLRDVQQALAMEYGRPDWKALTTALDDLALDRQSHAERVDAVLRHGWGGDRVLATRIIARHPDLAHDTLMLAAICGNVAEVQRRLIDDPARATHVDEKQWTALSYVAYSRIDEQHAVTIAQMLLDAGADPNFAFDDGWGNPFTPITGAIGLGEGVKPSHAQAVELVETLLNAGADPFDTQALYNTSIAGDDVFWTDMLWQRCKRLGTTDAWSRVQNKSLGGKFKVGTLNYLLGNAVGQNQILRATWLLEHGADASTIHSYSGRPVHTMARLSGFFEMATLLEHHGARVEPLTGAQAFHAALMRDDEHEVRALVAEHPEFIRRPDALLAVTERGRARATALLLELGAAVGGVDQDGISPLHRATQAGSVATIDVLLAAGADVDLREHKWNGTPLGWALVLKKPMAALRLAPISHDVRALTSSGRVARLETVLRDEPTLANHTLSDDNAPTPLFCLPDDDEAATNVTRILVAYGADPFMKNRKGRTAIEAARFRGLDDAADLMAPETDVT